MSNHNRKWVSTGDPGCWDYVEGERECGYAFLYQRAPDPALPWMYGVDLPDRCFTSYAATEDEAKAAVEAAWAASDVAEETDCRRSL